MFLEVTLLQYLCGREAQLPFSYPALHLVHPTKPHHLLGFKLWGRVLATMPIISPLWVDEEVTVATLTMDPEWAPTCSKGPAVEGHCMALATRRVVNKAKSGGLIIPIMTVMAVLITRPLRPTRISNTMVPPLTPLISLFILISKRMAESEKKGGSQKRVTLHPHSISCLFPLPVHHHHLLQLEKMVVENSPYIIRFHHRLNVILDLLMLQEGNRRKWEMHKIIPSSILCSSTTTLKPTLAVGSTKLRHTGAQGLVAVTRVGAQPITERLRALE